LNSSSSRASGTEALAARTPSPPALDAVSTLRLVFGRGVWVRRVVYGLVTMLALLLALLMALLGLRVRLELGYGSEGT